MPSWTLEEVAENTRAYGYSGIDLRLLEREVITRDLVRSSREQLRQLFPPDMLPTVVLGTWVSFSSDDPETRARNETEAEQYLGLASDLRGPTIRVYGGRAAELGSERNVDIAVRSLERLAPLGEEAGVVTGVETHHGSSNSAVVARTLERVTSQSVGAIWNIHHTAKAGDRPTDVIRNLRDRIVNVHIHDARRKGDGWELLLLGQGELPVRQCLRLLIESGFQGTRRSSGRRSGTPSYPIRRLRSRSTSPS